jgi:carboxypeptidase Q
MRSLSLVFSLFALSLVAKAQDDKLDQDMLSKIKAEGMNNSKVMDYAFYLTDANGPRLNNSTGYMKAANWAKAELTKIGLKNAAVEPWGEWGKSWDLEKSYVALTAPYYRPINAFPKSFCVGTNGLKNAEVIMLTAKDSVELMAFKGKLKGKIVVMPQHDTLKQTFTADASRYTAEDLKKMGDYDPKAVPERTRQGFPAGGRRPLGAPGAMSAQGIRAFLQQEGAIAVLSTTTRNHDGTLFVQGGGAYAKGTPENFLDVVLGIEDYNSIQRLLEHKIPVKLDMDVKTKFSSADTKGYNVIAELPGTDKSLKEQLVMIGGHLDSWHGGTGATDNAAGCAVMMEVMRILKATGVNPRRTIRVALWGGEESGLNGSRNYVKNHFTDTVARRFNKEGDKVSVYFNLDNGTGKVRGIYTQGNEAIKPIFTQWIKQFEDLGATTVTVQNTGGTDHQSFDAIGLPGFQFIQDGIEYNTRTHHSNVDTYDHLIPADLTQAATVIAAFVYNASQRDEKMPRKPAPAAPAASQAPVTRN